MAGSLAHLIAADGSFRADLIENGGDASEALEECFHLIRELAGDDMIRVSAACKKLGFVDPYTTDRCSDDPMPAPMKGRRR